MEWGSVPPPPLPQELPTTEPHSLQKEIGTYPARLVWGCELPGGSQEERGLETQQSRPLGVMWVSLGMFLKTRVTIKASQAGPLR